MRRKIHVRHHNKGCARVTHERTDEAKFPKHKIGFNAEGKSRTSPQHGTRSIHTPEDRRSEFLKQKVGFNAEGNSRTSPQQGMRSSPHIAEANFWTKEWFLPQCEAYVTTRKESHTHEWTDQNGASKLNDSRKVKPKFELGSLYMRTCCTLDVTSCLLRMMNALACQGEYMQQMHVKIELESELYLSKIQNDNIGLQVVRIRHLSLIYP